MITGPPILAILIIFTIIFIWYLRRCLITTFSDKKLVVATFLVTSLVPLWYLLKSNYISAETHTGLKWQTASFFSNEQCYKQINGIRKVDRERLTREVSKWNDTFHFSKVELFIDDNFALVITEQKVIGLSIIYYDSIQNKRLIYPDLGLYNILYPFPELN
jgi:hypothetical protein